MITTHSRENRRSPLRVAVIGCGLIAESHVQAWRNAGAKIVAVCDKDASLAKSKAEKWGIPRYYEDVSKMVRDEDLDIASICTPANVRLSVVRPIMENGIHAVIEKPFAMSVAEAEKMIELINKHGVRIAVVHNWLFSNIMKKTLHSLKGKEVGDVLGVEMDLLHTRDDPMAANPSHWCHSIEAGRFGEMLAHPIYLMRAILGEVGVKHISGSKLGSFPWMPIDELRILLEDENGRMASIYVSFNAARPETTLKVFGTTGILDVNLSNNILTRKQYRDIRIMEVIKDDLRFLIDYVNSCFSIAFAILTRRYKGMHTEFMKAFANSLINNTEPPVTAQEALEVVMLHKDLDSRIRELFLSKAREQTGKIDS